MDATTRYPEAVPMSSAKASAIVKQLLAFFTKFGLPKEIQSDQGSNFTSNLFKQTMCELGVRQVLSSAYHPQSQGALERHHQTLKSMLRKFCEETGKDWDLGVPFVLFAVREVPTESLGFSPNELVFGHRVRGPLAVVKEAWSGDTREPDSLLGCVFRTRERLLKGLEMARANLLTAQARMKD